MTEARFLAVKIARIQDRGAALQAHINGRAIQIKLSRRDVIYGGDGTISGIVTIEKIPASRKVRLKNRQDDYLVRETWSDKDGKYSFYNINPSYEYYAVAFDHNRVYNAVIQDFLKVK